MNRPIASGRGLTDDDRSGAAPWPSSARRSARSSSAAPTRRARRRRRRRSVPDRRPAGAGPDLQRGDLPRRERPHDPARDVHGPDGPEPQAHAAWPSSSAKKSDLAEVSALVLGRTKQAHHGIEDVEIKDLEAEAARSWAGFLDEMRGWRVVLSSLAATVLLVGGVGVLSVMLISFADRKYEIGLRKSLGASDGQILVQFLLEAPSSRRSARPPGRSAAPRSARPSRRCSRGASS